MMEKKKKSIFADNSPEAYLRRFEARQEWREAQPQAEAKESESTRLDPLVEAVVDKFYDSNNRAPELSELLPRAKGGIGFVTTLERTKKPKTKIVRIESLL